MVSCSFIGSPVPLAGRDDPDQPTIASVPAAAPMRLNQVPKSATASPAASWPISSSQPSQSPQNPILEPQVPLPVVPGLQVFDMELMHHYMVSTCYTLSRSPSVQGVWRDEAPRVGFTMPAVLHAILALSALHLARSDPSRRAVCIAHAHMHHTTAVRAVTPNLQSLASDNGVGLFLFSSLLCMFACANTKFENNNFLVLFEKGALAEWALLFRGTKTVIEYSSHDFKTGILSSIFMNGAQSNFARHALSLDQAQVYTWELKRMISAEYAHDPRTRRIYDEAVDTLGRTLAVVMKPGEGTRIQTADIFAWLLEVSNEYLEFLGQEEPIALIVFAYFCVALQQIEWMWWMEGLSSRLLMQLYSVLDKEYRGWLKWPQEQIGWHPLDSL
ncbi:uncharacterized protein BHQ10_003990 [Talaromyces amestolkiae]|uniref:C6 transcription factor n=1 Tax=Talaromyces amestolkiae TaxID=1196081 RepID=A0A364KWQ2_TALAM|nr:uncharacterized protein BHQ10_003990 [Talaromyces amestolkiae]RAO67978.1 hypothetical protein BHQ10_003990 [Talaromyces amestolkiae]